MSQEYNIDFSNENTIIWSMKLFNIELVAGFLAASVPVIYDLNKPLKSETYNIDTNADLSSFLVFNDIFEEEIKSLMSQQFRPNKYYIWLRGSKPYHYCLYGFQTNRFFQGVISMCNSCDVDFRNYIYGFPFDSQGNQYALSGYVMADNKLGYDAFDLDDVDEEERDNENIIEPLARTDDIIFDS